MVKLGILPGPGDRAGPPDDAASRLGPPWFLLCVGGWVTMMGALMASAPLIGEPAFVIKIGVLLVLAFPATYYLYYTRVSRRAINGTVLLAALVFGVFEFVLTWPEDGLAAFYGLTASYRLLVKGFLWVLAFRAIAIRGLGDIVLSVIPCMSCIILVMVAMPTPLAVVGTGMVVVGALFLMAAEYRVRSHHEGDPILAIRQIVWERGPRRGTALNTWQAVSAIVLIAAVGASAGASYMQGSSEVGRYVKNVLARYLAALMIHEREDFSPEPLLWLTGEPPPSGDRVVFVVDCDRGENWRQESYAKYTGRTWEVARRRRLRGTQHGGTWTFATDVVQGFRRAGAIEVRQVFHLRAPLGSALPGLFCPVRVTAPLDRVRLGTNGTIYCSGYLAPGQDYEIVSLVPAEGPTPRDAPLPPLEPELRTRYLQLPDALPARVSQLAGGIAAKEQVEDTYDTCLVLRQYLVDNYPYTLRPPMRPRDQDYVDHFLFEGKQGYCTHYASAMVVLCRTLGIPARFVTGFVAGELDPEADTYEVRAKDAHAWVEAYIEGRGWQSFDPTPPLDPSEERGVFGVVWASLKQFAADLLFVLQGFGRTRTWTLGWLAMALVSLLSAWGVHHHRRYRRVRLRGAQVSADDRIRFAYGQMLIWLGRFGYARRPSQAPVEYLRSIQGRAAPLAAHARLVTEAFLSARYGSGGVSEETARSVEAALAEMHRLLFKERTLSR